MNSTWGYVRLTRVGNIFDGKWKDEMDFMRRWKKGREEGKEAEGILAKHESLGRCSKNTRSHFETEEEYKKPFWNRGRDDLWRGVRDGLASYFWYNNINFPVNTRNQNVHKILKKCPYDKNNTYQIFAFSKSSKIYDKLCNEKKKHFWQVNMWYLNVRCILWHYFALYLMYCIRFISEIFITLGISIYMKSIISPKTLVGAVGI